MGKFVIPAQNDPDYNNDLVQQWQGKLYVGIDGHRQDGIGTGKTCVSHHRQ